MTKRKPKSVLVAITQLDIRDGEPSDPCLCPVARAMTRAIGQAVDVGADGWCLARSGGPDDPLPARVRKFIERFDAHARVEPMTFRITRL